MPVFRSPLQALLLARVLADLEQEFTVADLARVLEADLATVSRETTRLAQAGVLLERRVGRTRLLRANHESPVYEELLSLALKTYGLGHLVFERLRDLPGASLIVVFGSWAARYRGEPGRRPNDLDVLVVGSVSKVKATVRADELAERVGVPVNLSYVTAQEWEQGSVNLVREIKRTPHVVFEVSAR
jgi:DNA-binding transcriptional ArsR family regulator